MTICPKCGAIFKATAGDGRAIYWRTRIRLFENARGGDEPEADSDPDLPAGAPGTLILEGLPGVAEELQELARVYHVGKRLQGLEAKVLRHGLKSLRPTISRHGGSAVWRVHYTVDGAEWTACVDVIREPGNAT